MGSMIPAVSAFVVIAFMATIGAVILQSLHDDQTANSYARNASAEGLESIEEISEWLPTVALVVAASIILGLLFTVLYVRGRN